MLTNSCSVHRHCKKGCEDCKVTQKEYKKSLEQRRAAGDEMNKRKSEKQQLWDRFNELGKKLTG
jgi:hypothetical protein